MEAVTEVREVAWRDFLASARGANIYQTPQMSQVFSQTKRVAPQVVAIEAGGEIHALMLSAVISYGAAAMSRFTGRTVCVGGPLGAPSAFPALLAAHDAAASKRSLLTQIRNLAAPPDRAPFERAGYVWEDHLNYLVDLTNGEKALFEGMSKARRKGITHGDRAGLEVRELRRDDLEQAYALVKETYARAGVPLADLSMFRSANEILGREGDLWAVAAKLRGTACAVRFVLRWGGTLYDWYAGSSDEGRSVHADEWLVWQVLTRGMTQGYSTFDFGGAGRPEEPYGPREFKRRFGGTQTNPGRFQKVYRPTTAKIARTAYELWRGR